MRSSLLIRQLVPPSSINFGSFRPRIGATLHNHPLQLRYRHAIAMASTQDGEQQWPAAKVRSTYLEYFKKQEHTFGMLCPLSI